jgi:predicted regulator of Ras-like GTPase activity (Roadblock/LC7/MglB family)
MEMQQRKNGKRIILSQTAYHNIARILEELLSRSQARLALFADMNGYPVVYRGDADTLDLSALTALAAGDFAATAEMSRLIGQDKRFKFLYHEGTSRSLYLCAVGNDYFLLVVFEKAVALGIIRVLSHYAVEKISRYIQELKKGSEQTHQFLDFEFREQLAQQLDRSLRPK